MKKGFGSLVVVGLCLVLGGKVQAQFSLHAGYAPEKWTQKNTFEEKHSVQYQGFYLNALFSFENDFCGVGLGPQVRYHFLGSHNDLTSFSGNLPERQLIVEAPMMLYLRRFLTVQATTSWDYNVYVKRLAKIYPFIGVMPSYKINFGVANDFKPIDVYGLGGLMIGIHHFDFYFGVRKGLLDLDNSDGLKTSAFGWFFGFAVAASTPQD